MGQLAAMLAAATGLLIAPSPSAPPDDGAADSTAVSLRPVDDRMTVQVTINGAGPFRFVVDSGATRTVISRRLAQLLRLPDAGTAELHSVGGASTVALARIDRLTLGGLPARAIDAPVLEEANLGAAGILGIDALAGKSVVIDIDANRMTVEAARTRSAAAADSGEIVVTARRRYGQLVLADADAAGQRVWAIVDTGSTASIGNGQLQRRLVRRKRIAPTLSVITDVAGRAIPVTIAPISDMRLGTAHLRGPSIAFSDVHAFERFGLADKPSMLLGMDLLRSFRRVSIDFARRTVRLLPRPA